MDEPKPNETKTEAVKVYKTADVQSFFNPNQTYTLATFDPKTEEGRKLLILAAMDKCVGIKEVINKQIRIQHIYAHPASRVDEKTQEIQTWYRIVMLDDNGTAVECGSSGIGKSLSLLAMMYDNPPWTPPLVCEVKVEDLGRGRQFYKLIPVQGHQEPSPSRVRQRERGGNG